MNNSFRGLKRRTIRFGIVLALILYGAYYFLLTTRLESHKDELVLNVLQTDEELSSELYRVMHGLEDDFDFFENEIKSILKTSKRDRVQSLLHFLESHTQYFKIRLVDVNGHEIFKIVQSTRQDKSYQRSNNLFDLSEQKFFQDLKKASFDSFYFSSMDADVVNGIVQKPIRPTIRVAKRVLLSTHNEALLVINIDGHSILNLFNESWSKGIVASEKILSDQSGSYLASLPLLNMESYTVEKKNLPENISSKLLNTSEVHGSFDQNAELIVFTRFPLPRSSEKWFLVSKISGKKILKVLRNERLTWIFWELLVFILCTTWYWKAEKKKFKEQVIQVLLRERGEFIQNVSHQLKTPLAILSNYFTSEDDLKMHSAEIRSELSHLIRVIDDLMLLSHMESFKNITLERENIVEILQDALTMVSEKAKVKNVVFKLNIDEKLIESFSLLERNVRGELLKSAFFNILDNAVNFSPPEGEIRIFVKFIDQRVVISIVDQGKGVPEDFMPFMFNRFTRAKGQDRKGSGLGLAITKKIIDLHQGNVTYLKEETGACFQITL